MPKFKFSWRYTGGVGIYNSNRLEILVSNSNIMCGVIQEVEKEGFVSVKHYLKVAYGTFRHRVSFNPDTTNNMGSIPFFHICTSYTCTFVQLRNLFITCTSSNSQMVDLLSPVRGQNTDLWETIRNRYCIALKRKSAIWFILKIYQHIFAKSPPVR